MRENLLRNRPAVFAGLALGIGIAVSRAISFSDFYLLSAIAAGLASLLLRRLPAVRLSLLFFSFCLLGAMLMSRQESSYRDSPLSHLSELKIPQAVLTGRIVQSIETASAYEWVVETDSIGVLHEPPIAYRAAVLLRLSKQDTSKIPLPENGSRVRVYSSLEPFRTATNPHEFAGELKLQTDTHTEAQGFIHSRYDYYVLAPPVSSLYSHVADWVEHVHASITKLLDTAILDEPSRGFVEAVVLGDRGDMEKETLNDFTTSGVSHILAVSGFNVAIIALVIAQLLRLFGFYWHRPRVIVTMVGVLLYSAIVGFQPSVVRALLMIELYLLALLIERKPDPINIILGAAAINLLLRPSDLFDVGFQLSYSAVLGLILIAPPLKLILSREPNEFASEPQMKRERMLNRLGDAVALSLGATIASYPIIATHFYRVSFIGIVANVPIIPLSAIITALGFLLIPITLLSTWAGQLYGEATTYLTKGLLLLTKACAHVPGAASAAAAPSWVYIVFLIFAVIYALRAMSRRHFVGRVSLCVLCFFVLTAFRVPMRYSVLNRNEDKLQLLFFDVGEGDCILLHTPAGKNYCIDFGTVSRTGNAVAERTALPFLRAENETHIEAGFITHMHRDHFGGAPTLVEQCSVGALYSSGERVSDSLARRLDHDARERNVHCQTLSRGDTVHLDSEITLFVLHPERRDIAAGVTTYGQHVNSGSLAFKLVYRNTSVLFLGDVERSEEEEMRSAYGAFLRSDVVKVAHHGSLTSSSKEFVAATQPKYAVISVGEHNRFGHPAPAIVKRWMTSGAAVLRTDLGGAVLLTSDGERVGREEWR